MTNIQCVYSIPETGEQFKTSVFVDTVDGQVLAFEHVFEDEESANVFVEAVEYVGHISPSGWYWCANLMEE